MIHYSTSELPMSQCNLKCSADDPDADVYVDVSNGDPVHYDCLQLKSLEVGESMDIYTCKKLASVSDSMDKLVENPVYGAYLQRKNEEDMIENIYETIPGQFHQD